MSSRSRNTVDASLMTRVTVTAGPRAACERLARKLGTAARTFSGTNAPLQARVHSATEETATGDMRAWYAAGVAVRTIRTGCTGIVRETPDVPHASTPRARRAGRCARTAGTSGDGRS